MNPSKRKKLYRLQLVKEKAVEPELVKEDKKVEEVVHKEEVKEVEPVVVPEPVVEAAVETVPEVTVELQPEVLVVEETLSTPAPTGKKKKSV